MITILALLAGIALVFGFCLAWICRLVADADIEVQHAATAIVLTLVAGVFVVVVLREAVGAPPWIVTSAGAGISWLILGALVVSYAGVRWKHGLIISGVYAVLQTLVFTVGVALLS